MKVVQAEQKVQSTALQGVMQSAPNMSGAVNLSRGIATLGNDIARKENYEQNLTDKAKVRQADIDFQKFNNETIYGEDGYLNKKGLDAFDGEAQEEYLATINETGEDVMGGLDNQAQKDMFSILMQTRGMKAGQLGIRHAKEQKQVWMKQTSDARIEQAVQGAVLDPNTINVNRGVMAQEIIEQGAMAGMGDLSTPELMAEAIAAKDKSVTYLSLESADSMMHLTVAKAMFDQDRPEEAKALIDQAVHFAQERDENGQPTGKRKAILNGEDKLVFDKMFKKSTFKVKAHEIMSQVWDDNADLDDMIAAGRKKAGKNVEMGDEIERRIKNRDSVANSVRLEQQNEVVDDIGKSIIDGEKTIEDLTMEEEELLTVSQIRYLQGLESPTYEKELERGSYMILNAAYDLSPSELQAIPMEEMYDKMTKGDRDKLRSLIQISKKPASQASTSEQTLLSETAMEKIYLKRIGADKANKSDIHAQRALRFNNEANYILALLKESKGRKLTMAEREEVYKELSTKHIVEEGMLWFDDETRFEYETDNNAADFRVEEIQQQLISDGVIPTKENVNEMFAGSYGSPEKLNKDLKDNPSWYDKMKSNVIRSGGVPTPANINAEYQRALTAQKEG